GFRKMKFSIRLFLDINLFYGTNIDIMKIFLRIPGIYQLLFEKFRRAEPVPVHLAAFEHDPGTADVRRSRRSTFRRQPRSGYFVSVATAVRTTVGHRLAV